jgi:hypothetical protein
VSAVSINQILLAAKFDHFPALGRELQQHDVDVSGRGGTDVLTGSCSTTSSLVV